MAQRWRAVGVPAVVSRAVVGVSRALAGPSVVAGPAFGLVVAVALAIARPYPDPTGEVAAGSVVAAVTLLHHS